MRPLGRRDLKKETGVGWGTEGPRPGICLESRPSHSPSQVALVVKNLPVNAGDKETQVQSLGWENPLEEEMATHSSILAQRIPWTEELGGLEFLGSQTVGYN